MKTPRLGTTITKRVTQTAGGVTAHIGSQLLGPMINKKEPEKGVTTAHVLMGIVGAFGDEVALLVDPDLGYGHAAITGLGDGLYTYSSTALAVNQLKKLDKKGEWKWKGIGTSGRVGNTEKNSLGNANAAHAEEDVIVRDNGYTVGSTEQTEDSSVAGHAA